MSASINFYLDKPDKKGNAPIFLRINCNNKQAKISIGEKIAPAYFDKENQLALDSYPEAIALNNYLCYLKDRANELINKSTKKTFTAKEIKNHLHDFVQCYKEDHTVSIVEEQLPLYGKSFSFIDFFAGAGGFSEGFLQAEIGNKYFEFLGASDINENCELTHVVRYNHQLDATGPVRSFLKQEQVHDYSNQGQGPVHKIQIESSIYDASDVYSSKASLYRPTTKKGDPRIWFQKLKRHASPNDILAIIFFDEKLHVLNLTKTPILSLIHI